ncbi:MAG: VWA domain-containing protein, partial [Psychromonas sp.]
MSPETTLMPLEFLRPYWLLGVVAVCLFALLNYTTVKNKQHQSLIAAHLSKQLVSEPKKSLSLLFPFNLLAIIACIALSGPTWRQHQLPVYEIQKAQFIALDLSYSMYATDTKPNRLSQAKYKAIDLIKSWQEGEKGLIAFAGDAFTIAPLTRDGNAIISHISHLSPDIMPVAGSRPDLALALAITGLQNAGYQRGHIVFITDGIDQNSADKMVNKLKGSNWVVSILAMGTQQGAAITLADGSLLKDQFGQIVIPTLDPLPLLKISRASDGLYANASYRNTDIEQLGDFYSVDQAMKKETQQQGKNKLAIDDGYWLVFLLIPLFLILFRKGLFYVLLLTFTLPLSAPKVEASIWKNDRQNAFQAYQNEDYAQASSLYSNPFEKGSALYKNGQYQQALSQFEQATIETPDNAAAFYNQGNSYAQLQDFDKAIAAYQQSLSLDSTLIAAQENIKLLEKLKEQQQ